MFYCRFCGGELERVEHPLLLLFVCVECGHGHYPPLFGGEELTLVHNKECCPELGH